MFQELEEVGYIRDKTHYGEIPTGFKKGGLVDYTGPAMVHGSKTSPEAFLNAEQTKLFSELRDVMSGTKMSSLNSSVIIDKIEIRTDSMNSNQDFKSAGKTLAEEFNKAIKNRGINVNMKN